MKILKFLPNSCKKGKKNQVLLKKVLKKKVNSNYKKIWKISMHPRWINLQKNIVLGWKNENIKKSILS